jgi:cellulose synthase/poly-beta-1,6-N-acetylglucosamine synthase-like glycosyltransferase
MIVPVKNEEGNIENCITSCLNSTYPKKEVVVVNDGNTDNTGKILKELAYKNPSLKVIHLQKSAGKKQAIEKAVEIAKGDIFLFIDSDCNIATDDLEKVVQIFLSDPTIGAVTGCSDSK